MANNKKKAGQAITPKKEVIQKKSDRRLYITLAVSILALAAIVLGIVLLIKATSGTKMPLKNTETTKPATASTYYADISIKDYGTVTVKLDRDAAPITVDNFVTLARSGFYDGLTFHRIMNGFMMQGGRPGRQRNGWIGNEHQGRVLGKRR